MQSTLILSTCDGERIIKRLTNHWRHKFNVMAENDTATIPFSDDDKVVLTSNIDTLVCTLTTKEEETHAKLQSVVLNHINRMAGVEFDKAWQMV